MKYDELLDEASRLELKVMETNLPIENLKGIYIDGNIIIEKGLSSQTEKKCVLAEEIGHAIYTVGDILIQNNTSNLKQERLARSWAYEKLVNMDKLIDAFENGIKGRFQLSEFLDLTEEFIDEALQYYNYKYGPYKQVRNYLIYFSPLGIIKRF
ncbi:MAG: ImmA/IrrE family metallo-endopeptidase [Clostridia bacterium]|nr:ImmA/IrrE family metallo-endopeptidase [Clostridia bacterium]